MFQTRHERRTRRVSLDIVFEEIGISERRQFHAPCSDERSAGYANHRYRIRTGTTARGPVIDGRTCAFPVAAAGFYLDQSAPEPRRTPHRELRPMAKP